MPLSLVFGPPPPSSPAVLSFSNVSASVTGPMAARVSWDVSPGAQGEVRYGTTQGGPYGSATIREEAYLTFHSQPLADLAEGTTYYFVAWGRDANGGEWTSEEGSFSTPDAPSPSADAIYGPGIGGDTLANTTQTAGVNPTFDRFRAEQSSALSSVVFYWLGAADPGYSTGNGAILRVELWAVDGDGYPTGSALATETMGALDVHSAARRCTFSSPYTVSAGTLYAIVWRNMSGTPNSQHFALDRWYYWDGASGSGFPGRINPRFPDTDWAHGYWNGSSWVTRGGYTPILGIDYANGQSQGQCYGEASLGSGQQGRITGGATEMVRERFTVSGGARSVAGAGVRLLRQSGSAPLVVSLHDGAGSLIDSFEVAASSVPQAGAPNGQDGGGPQRSARWVTGAFASPRTLSDGGTYSLRLSTAAGTIYWAWVQRRLRYGYSSYAAATCFTDGIAERTTNGGASWSALGSATNEHDLQFYLALQE